MSSFTIQIETDNDAFCGGNRRDEVLRILRELTRKLRDDGMPCGLAGYTLRDANGNAVGYCRTSFLGRG